MAKSAKKSLKGLFSKSDANLKESAENDESKTTNKTFQLFKWKKKRKADRASPRAARADSPEATLLRDGDDWPDAEQKPSIYATTPRSKKGLLSHSETDLRKPRHFSTFSLAFKKKKKNRDISQSITSITTESEFKGQIVEGENESYTDQEQAAFNKQAHCAITEPKPSHISPHRFITDEACHSDVRTDSLMSCEAGGEEGAVGFMLVSMDSDFISYIDSSVSDNEDYHTPSESPVSVPVAFGNTHTIFSSTDQSLTSVDLKTAKPFSTYSKVPSEIDSQIMTTPDHAISETLNVPFTLADFTVQTHNTTQSSPHQTEVVLSCPEHAKSQVDGSTEDFPANLNLTPKVLDDVTTDAIVGQRDVTSPFSTEVSVNSLLIKNCDANTSSAADNCSHSVALHNAEIRNWGMLKNPMEIAVLDPLTFKTNNEQVEELSVAHTGSDVNYTTLAFTHSSPSSANNNHTIQVSSVSSSDSTPVITPNAELSIDNMEVTTGQKSSRDCVSPTSGDSFHKDRSGLSLKSLDCPVLPEVTTSHKELSGFCLSDGNSEVVSIPLVDAPFTGTESSVEPVSHNSEPVQLQDESNVFSSPQTTSSIINLKTVTLDLSESSLCTDSVPSDLSLTHTHSYASSHMSGLEYINQESDLPRLSLTDTADSSSLFSDTFNTDALTTMALTDSTNIFTDLSSHTQQPDDVGNPANLETNKIGGSGEDHQISVPEVSIWGEQSEKIFCLSEKRLHHDFICNNDPAMGTVTLGNDHEPIKEVNENVEELQPVKSVNKRYTPEHKSGDESPVKVDLNKVEFEKNVKINQRTGENFAEIQQIDKKEEIQEVLGSLEDVEDNPGLQQVLYIEQNKTQVYRYTAAQEWSDRVSETWGGEVDQQLSGLQTMKPDVPVPQACSSEECTSAPPRSPHGETSVACRSLAMLAHRGAGYGPSLQSDWLITPHEAGGGAVDVSLRSLGEGDSIHTQVARTATYRVLSEVNDAHFTAYKVEEDTHRSDYTDTRGSPNPEIHSIVTLYTPHPVGESTLSPLNTQETLQQGPGDKEEQDTHRIAIATGSTHADSVSTHTKLRQAASHCTDTSSSITSRTSSAAGVIVYIREFGLAEGGSERDIPNADRPPRAASPGGFFHACPVLSTVTEESDSQAETSGSDTEMSSGVGVLSTTLTLRPKVSQNGSDEGKRVHKVSLVNNSSTTDSSTHKSLGNENGQDVPDSSAELSESSPPEGLFSSCSSSHGTERSLPSAIALDTSGSSGNNSLLNVRSEVQSSADGEAGRRSWEELAAPAGRSDRERDGGIASAGWDSHTLLPESEDGFYFGVFKATRVELPASPTDADSNPALVPSLAPASPASPHDMDSLLDTLKSMGPSLRHRTSRNNTGQAFSSLPPIVEDAPSSTAIISGPTSLTPAPISLPPDLGLNWTSVKTSRSPLTMMKEQQGSDAPVRNIILPSRASAISSIVMRKSSLPDLRLDEGPQMNGGSLLGSSRLEHSMLFSSYRTEQPIADANGKSPGQQRSLYRAISLPEVSSTNDCLSSPTRTMEQLGLGSSYYESLPLYMSPTNSLTGLSESSHISMPPSLLLSPTALSPTANHTMHFGLDLNRSLSPEPLIRHPAPPSLQRSLSGEGFHTGLPILNEAGHGFGVSHKPVLERNTAAKYRAFPDAYLTKEKEHGKVNPRPGKMYIYDRPGLFGKRIEVRGDVMDATAWQFPETISIRVVRGGWVLYERPDFKGEKIALDEGDIELSFPFSSAEGDQSLMQNGTEVHGEDPSKPTAQRRFIIGSLRRAVRDYSVPEICLFPEENAEGKKVVFRDTSEDARIFGFPIRANSIIINAGLWLVFAEPFFQGVPRVLEVGGFTNPAAWGVTQPYIGSLHPLKIGEPRVEKPNEPKLVIYEKPYFTGKSREIYTNVRDFITKEDKYQSVFMYNAGSIKVIGGVWVGYEKEGFRGHQYLLEEGEYHDWRVWGGTDAELRSVRVIRTELNRPTLILFEMPVGEEEDKEERTFEVMEAVPDVELFGFRPATRSIHVLSGAWVAYSHVDYSGNQYILEKGFYNTCADWGSEDNRICSVQPILLAPAVGPDFRNELFVYSEPGFQGNCQVYKQNQDVLPEGLLVQSCRVVGGSWVLYDDIKFTGNQYVLSEGDYPNYTSIGCPPQCPLRSAKSVPMLFAVPSISLFGHECFEGREVTFNTEVSNMMAEGINPHFLSVKVNSGCWVLCEHSNYRGHQYLLEPIEITNWHKFSSLTSVGSMYPLRAHRSLFRIRYKETGHYMSVQGGVDGIKTGRVVVSEHIEAMSDIWYYQDGLIKNKLDPNMSLQVVGNVEPGAKVVLWSETRTPIQTWKAQLSGSISSLTFPGLVLDVKGGKAYDKEHVIVRSETDESPGYLWELELI